MSKYIMRINMYVNVRKSERDISVAAWCDTRTKSWKKIVPNTNWKPKNMHDKFTYRNNDGTSPNVIDLLLCFRLFAWNLFPFIHVR